jgi:putative membrane protein
MEGDGKDDSKEPVDLAVHRTLLASERTFAAWIRTGLASTVAGIAVAQFLSNQGASWAGMAVAVMLIVSGGGLCLVAIWRYRRDRKRFRSDGRAGTVWLVEIIGFAFLAASLLSLLLVLG